MNVQIVGNADLKFLDVVARWPGSTHDATIFANSTLRARFENHEFPNSLLVGKYQPNNNNFDMDGLLMKQILYYTKKKIFFRRQWLSSS